MMYTDDMCIIIITHHHISGSSSTLIFLVIQSFTTHTRQMFTMSNLFPSRMLRLFSNKKKTFSSLSPPSIKFKFKTNIKCLFWANFRMFYNNNYYYINRWPIKITKQAKNQLSNMTSGKLSFFLPSINV
mgnify:CR=1 FL=1